MRLAVPIAVVALAAALLSGCGGSASESESTTTGPAAPQGGAATAPAGASAQNCDDVAGAESLRATGVPCSEARAIVASWTLDDACAGSQGISHIACTVRPYRCIGTRTERGLSVSCAGPGRSIAFISRR
jgi:hypothetical protein